MRAILAALIQLAQRTGRFTVAEATAIYNGLWIVVGLALLACAAGFVMNERFGWTAPSLVLAIVFAIVALYLWAKPLHILIVAGFGLANRITGDPTLADEVEKVFEKYLNLLKWVLLVGVTFLFITGTISFKENPGAVLPFLVALGVIGLFKWLWPNVFPGATGRKVVYGYAILVVALSLGSLIPGAVWVKYMPYGWDPLTAKPTDTEEALYRLNQKRREIADADRATELNRITSKVDRREALTQSEERFIADAERSQSKKDSDRPYAIVPLPSAPRSSGILVIPARSKSELVLPSAGQHPDFTGFGKFLVHNVKAAGGECSFGEAGCVNGPLLKGYYVSNESNVEITVTFEFKYD